MEIKKKTFIKLYWLFDIADIFRPCLDNILTIGIIRVLLALHSHRIARKGRESVSFSGLAGSKQCSLPGDSTAFQPLPANDSGHDVMLTSQNDSIETEQALVQLVAHPLKPCH